jgi:hypothetical protein
LVRSSAEKEPDLLVATIQAFAEFALSAALIRLERLQFAANSNGEILSWGRPLPALPGRQFALHGRIAIPAGFTWEPRVSPEALERLFGISGDGIILWNEDGSVTRIHSEQFIPVTRSSVQATLQNLRASR